MHDDDDLMDSPPPSDHLHIYISTDHNPLPSSCRPTLPPSHYHPLSLPTGRTYVPSLTAHSFSPPYSLTGIHSSLHGFLQVRSVASPSSSVILSSSRDKSAIAWLRTSTSSNEWSIGKRWEDLGGFVGAVWGGTIEGECGSPQLATPRLLNPHLAFTCSWRSTSLLPIVNSSESVLNHSFLVSLSLRRHW